MNETGGMIPGLAHESAMLLHTGLLKGAPLLWAALGGTFSERSGIVNIGLEGMMLTGAFFGVAVSGVSGDPWLGLAAGALGGGLAGGLHAAVCIRGRADQIVSGMGINLIAMGLTGFLLFQIFGARGNSPEVPKLPAVTEAPSVLPGLPDWLFPLSILHIALLGVWLASLQLLYRTRFGLRLRACGEDPRVVEAAGARVNAYRYTGVIISGVLAGLGGVQLSLSDISQFSTGMTNGRGFVALAILICSGWRPGRAAAICLFFGCAEALAERLQGAWPSLPSRLLLALPFLLALIILASSRQSMRAPQALGKDLG